MKLSAKWDSLRPRIYLGVLSVRERCLTTFQEKPIGGLVKKWPRVVLNWLPMCLLCWRHCFIQMGWKKTGDLFVRVSSVWMTFYYVNSCGIVFKIEVEVSGWVYIWTSLNCCLWKLWQELSLQRAWNCRTALRFIVKYPRKTKIKSVWCKSGERDHVFLVQSVLLQLFRMCLLGEICKFSTRVFRAEVGTTGARAVHGRSEQNRCRGTNSLFPEQ